MTEHEFQKDVIRLAHAHGWLVHHIADSRRVFVRGFPDLVMLHPAACRLIFSELKSDKGKLRKEQKTWISTLLNIKGVETYVWKPADWDTIEQVLDTGDKSMYNSIMSFVAAHPEQDDRVQDAAQEID